MYFDTLQVFTELESIVEKLAKEAGKGTMNFKVPSNAVLNNTSDSPKDGNDDDDDGQYPSSSSA